MNEWRSLSLAPSPSSSIIPSIQKKMRKVSSQRENMDMAVLTFMRLLFGVIFCLGLQGAGLAEPQTAAVNTLPQVETYEQLVGAIRLRTVESHKRIEEFAGQEKVREAWDIGKYIDNHVLRHKERADYQTYVMERLSRDLAMSKSELYRMLKFYRTYPIVAVPPPLSWAHYRELLSVDDEKERQELEKESQVNHWSSKQLREEIQRRRAAKNPNPGPDAGAGVKPAPTLKAQPGKVGTYRIVRAKAGPEAGELVIDLGFSNYYRTSKKLRSREWDIVEITGTNPEEAKGSLPTDKIKTSKRTVQDLFTYPAYVFQVIDGDTIKVVVDLGFGVRSVQTLRLRGLDAPEIESREGKEAKAFLESLIAGSAPAKTILIRTTRSDKYDRYLADIWVNGEYGSARNVQVSADSAWLTQAKYVNQELVAAGFAVVVSD